MTLKSVRSLFVDDINHRLCHPMMISWEKPEFYENGGNIYER